MFEALENREVLPAAAAGPGPGPGGAQGAAGHGGQEQEGGAADREEDRGPQPRQFIPNVHINIGGTRVCYLVISILILSDKANL